MNELLSIWHFHLIHLLFSFISVILCVTCWNLPKQYLQFKDNYWSHDAFHGVKRRLSDKHESDSWSIQIFSSWFYYSPSTYTGSTPLRYSWNPQENVYGFTHIWKWLSKQLLNGRTLTLSRRLARQCVVEDVNLLFMLYSSSSCSNKFWSGCFRTSK